MEMKEKERKKATESAGMLSVGLRIITPGEHRTTGETKNHHTRNPPRASARRNSFWSDFVVDLFFFILPPSRSIVPQGEFPPPAKSKKKKDRKNTFHLVTFLGLSFIPESVRSGGKPQQNGVGVGERSLRTRAQPREGNNWKGEGKPGDI
jgi:hypothetical protein